MALGLHCGTMLSVSSTIRAQCTLYSMRSPFGFDAFDSHRCFQEFITCKKYVKLSWDRAVLEGTSRFATLAFRERDQLSDSS